MLIDFFWKCANQSTPASLQEFLDLMEALQHRFAFLPTWMSSTI